jgi:hypothetical protein
MRRAWLAACVLLLAGCRGGAVTTTVTTTAQPPRIPGAVAQQLASESDAVSAALVAGDGCGALAAAQRLRTDATNAINTHQIPGAFQEVLLDRVNGIASEIACTPTTPAPPPHDHGKHKGRHKPGDGNDQGG